MLGQFLEGFGIGFGAMFGVFCVAVILMFAAWGRSGNH